MLVLADDFLARICEDYGLGIRSLTEDAQAALLAHPWPGNVRELANVLERAALLSDGTRLSARDLGLVSATAIDMAREPASVASVTIGDDVEAESERSVLLDVLRATGWNFTRAAGRLGLPRNTLRYRVERLGLVPEGPPVIVMSGGASPALRLAREGSTSWRPTCAMQPGAEMAKPTGPSAPPRPARGRPTTASRRAPRRSGTGGRIETTGPAELLAAFGLEPDEDAPRRAAYAALAVRTLAARARSDAMDVPAIAIALHAEQLSVIREERRPGRSRRLQGRARALDGLIASAPPGSVTPPPRPAGSSPAASI